MTTTNFSALQCVCVQIKCKIDLLLIIFETQYKVETNSRFGSMSENGFNYILVIFSTNIHTENDRYNKFFPFQKTKELKL